jgi:hypothetical protein
MPLPAGQVMGAAAEEAGAAVGRSTDDPPLPSLSAALAFLSQRHSRSSLSGTRIPSTVLPPSVGYHIRSHTQHHAWCATVTLGATPAAAPPVSAAVGSAVGAPTDEWEEVATTHRSKTERAPNAELYQYIPVRLSPKERDFFSVLEGTLQVSEYTDNVDTYR